MNILLRSEKTSDIKLIETLTTQAFLNAQHTDHTEQFIVSALRVADALSISLVVEVNSKVVAHIAISPITITDGSRAWYGLGPISVLPEYQGAGIGSLLIDRALERLKKLDASGCVVLGDPTYYQRFAFKVEADLILAGVPAEYFQTLLFVGDLPKGTVSYHDAFNATS